MINPGDLISDYQIVQGFQRKQRGGSDQRYDERTLYTEGHKPETEKT